jgi:TPR repeat protein
MNSPDEDPKSEPELDYAPPWAREHGARGQVARDQTAREQAGGEQTAREQFRAALRHSGGPAVEQAGQNEPESRSFGDDRPWHQRALDPERVPAPPAGGSNVWPLLTRLFAVCAIAAMVAAAVVFLFSPRQPTHKIAQANALAPASATDDAPALAVDPSAGGTAPPPQDQAAAVTPQLPEAQVVTALPPRTEAPAPQIASLQPPNSPAPAANESAPRPADANPAASDPKPAASPPAAPSQAAPAQGAPQVPPQAAVVLDENEINTLIRRGKNLLSDGDFAAARVLFERAANAGSAEAALALGSTYDPNVIERLSAIMVKPDIASARKWYQLAAERGSAAASLQLANLPQGR